MERIEPDMRSSLVLALALAIAAAGCGKKGQVAATTHAEEERPSYLRDPGLKVGWKTDFTKSTVRLSEFESGGPGKDGIPALSDPKLVEVRAVDYLKPREPVIALEVEDAARAYPLEILTWHEIVNDDVAGIPVGVTFCPLCNTALVFDRRVEGTTLEFGTTGNLRNSDLVMYDRQTESWWQQFSGEAVVGRYAGKKLRQLPAHIVAWREFERDHPDGRVLSRDTGYSRPYGRNPYAGYDEAGTSPIFPAAHADDRRLLPKERVVFVRRGRESVAVPFPALAKARQMTVDVAGHRLEIRFHAGVASALDSASIAFGRDVGAAQVTENGTPVPFSEPFWFAVAAFRPEVALGARRASSPSARADARR
jgi:Protein of unknown function (DUF3179)